jgi:cytochrome c biogenesis factor
MLYLGYVGFSVPFAFAIGSLITRQPGDRCAHSQPAAAHQEFSSGHSRSFMFQWGILLRQ